MRRASAIFGLAALLTATVARAESIGTVVYGTGNASVFKEFRDRKAPPLLPIDVGDDMTTAFSASIKILMEDQSVLMIRQDSQLKVLAADLRFGELKRAVKFQLVKGDIRLIISEFMAEDQGYIVETSAARIVIPQGDVVIRHNSAGGYTEVFVLEGKVLVENALEEGSSGEDAKEAGPGRISVGKGQMSLTTTQTAPSAPAFLPPRDLENLRKEYMWMGENVGGDPRIEIEAIAVENARSTFDLMLRKAGRPDMPIYGPQDAFTKIDRPQPELPRVSTGSSKLNVQWSPPPGTQP